MLSTQRERERECVCVCVCERERERKGELELGTRKVCFTRIVERERQRQTDRQSYYCYCKPLWVATLWKMGAIQIPLHY